MLSLTDFTPLVRAAIPRFGAQALNARQEECVLHEPAVPLAIFAGPGTGKTTVLVLRALRLVFVEGLQPEQVLLTTFTRKAASEIRSRLIEWGLALVDWLAARGPASVRERLHLVDVSRFLTGTLDSLCEQVLTTLRDPADPAPVLVESFVGNALLMSEGLFPSQAAQHPALKAYLAHFTADREPPRNFGELLKLCRTLGDRLLHDQVDVQAWRQGGPHASGRECLARAMEAYQRSMLEGHKMDFALLEHCFHQRLATGRLERFTSSVRAVLVDEYQDTNPLQESIYFELVRRTRASLTVVGDDDQSLYRFRGATVELFRDFCPRFARAVPELPAPRLKYLVDNYRSSPEIIHFLNHFIQADPAFLPARVQPPKPALVARQPSQGLPVLGLFRQSLERLAEDLVELLCNLFRGSGQVRTAQGHLLDLSRSPQGGDFGDAVFLSHSVNEYTRSFRGSPPRPRLPLLLRERLRLHGVEVFNPRGRELSDIPLVQQLLGLVLECVDPQGTQQARLKLPVETREVLQRWRKAAEELILSHPPPHHPHGLRDFVLAWQRRAPQASMSWPQEWPLLELCFKLLAWLPRLQDDPEGQVWLEAIARCMAQASSFSTYRAALAFSSPLHEERSVQRALQDILAPIAEGSVEVDEDIMPHVPRGRLPLMTIHQAKGLEYPLVVVDVGSDYRKDNPKQRFRRFPEQPSTAQLLEDDLAPYCATGPLRQGRAALERTFDDLRRLYYVAYSRPQCALLLVGTDACIAGSTRLKNVATGWRVDGTWAWSVPYEGPRPPALANALPLTLI